MRKNERECVCERKREDCESVRVGVGAWVCVREQESERECVREIACIYVCVSEGECGCECVCERERKKERVCARKRAVLIMSRFRISRQRYVNVSKDNNQPIQKNP